MTRSPAFRFYPADFLVGTLSMSLEARGAYITLLCHQWDKGPIPKDKARELAGNPSPMAFDEILEKFSEKKGSLFNRRIEAERLKQMDYSEKQRKNANLRWKVGNALAIPSLCSSSSSSSSSSITEKEKIKNTSNGFDGFPLFWSAYPKKVEKQKVIEWFQKTKPEALLVGHMIAAIEIQKTSDQWQRGFIKNPMTWLNRGCWEDEPRVDAAGQDVMDQWMQEYPDDQT